MSYKVYTDDGTSFSAQSFWICVRFMNPATIFRGDAVEEGWMDG